MHLVHSFPTIGLVIIYLRTERLIIKESHWVLAAPLVPIYGTVNYFATKRRGQPIYWFLSWEDWTTGAIVAGIFTFVIILWITLAKITKWGK